MGLYSRIVVSLTLAMLLFTATCGGHQRNGAQPSGLTSTNTTPAKTASAIPVDVRLVASDAGIALSAGGYTLSWKYENPGDYSQDGIVGLEDIAPLSEHFNEAVSAQNEWIDGNGDGVIGVADITPIAMNWASEVTGYRIDGADAAEGPWNEVASLTIDEGDTAAGRLALAQEIAPGYTYYRVVTLTPDGDAASSEALVAPSNEPVIYGVTPTSGYQHEECTFTATASGQEPLTYAWDFGGGASPNISSDISPTVTLSDAGEYSAALTISNSYGPTTYPFTLTVNARDTWVHLWGGNSDDQPESICVDDEGNIWVGGTTSSYSVGIGDVLVMKWSPQGELLKAKTWGIAGPGSSCGADFITQLPGGTFLVVGSINGAGQGASDILFLKYDIDMNLIWAKTWGTPDYDSANHAALTPDGGIAICGSIVAWADENDVLTAKYDSDGNVLWAQRWGQTDAEYGMGLAAKPDGTVYALTTAGDLGPGLEDIIILEYNGDTGALQHSLLWGGEQDESPSSVRWAGNQLVICGRSKSIIPPSSAGFLMWVDIPQLECEYIYGNDSSFINFAMTSRGTIYIGGQKGVDNKIAFRIREISPDREVINGWQYRGDSLETLLSMTLDSEDNLYISGRAQSALGAWEPVNLTVSSGESTLINLEAAHEAVTGITEDVIGTETEPVGVLDIGGGDRDVILLKNMNQ